MSAVGEAAGWVYLAFAVLVALLNISFVLRHFPRLPFGDHWIWLALLYERGLPGALYAQINEHRTAVPGLFYFLDHRYFGSGNALLIAVSMLLQVGCILLVAAPLWRESPVPKPARRVFAGFSAVLLLWFIQGENFFYVFQICIGLANLGILGAFALSSKLPEAAGTRSEWRLLGGILLCGFLATFSFAHGMLIWPALLVMGLVTRLRARALGVILLGFAVAAAIYFFDYKTPAGSASPLESLAHPVRVARYLVTMLALPFLGDGATGIGFSNRAGSYAVTVAGILSAAAMLVRLALVRPAERNRTEVFYHSVLVLCLGSAFVTALGRSHFPLEQALSGRYAPIPLLFWLGLAALATIYISRGEAQGGLGRAIWCGVLVTASVATLSTNGPKGAYLAARARGQDAAALSILSGVPHEQRVSEELATPSLVAFVDKKATAFLGHSMFDRPEAARLGAPLLQHFQLAPAGVCAGLIDGSAALGGGMQLAGWSWNQRNNRPTVRIWIADEQNVLRGLGTTEIYRPDVAAAYGDDAKKLAGWSAYSRLGPRKPATLTAFAELGEGNTVCQVGEPRTIVP